MRWPDSTATSRAARKPNIRVLLGLLDLWRNFKLESKLNKTNKHENLKGTLARFAN
jgi:hypothetical protein